MKIGLFYWLRAWNAALAARHRRKYLYYEYRAHVWEHAIHLEVTKSEPQR